jgi:hypothetical protein
MQTTKLPIGIQSFEKLRTGGFIYIDKTLFIARMASQAGTYFLSRPRRQGIWIFEFKVKGLDKSGNESPLAQILRKGYAAKYHGHQNACGQALPIRQIGIIFDEVTRNVVSWEEAKS